MGEEEKKEKEEKLPTPEELEAAQNKDSDEQTDDGGDPDLGKEERDYVAEATEGGWKSEEEHTGDAPWIDAKEFVGRKPLFDAIHKSNKRVKDLTVTVENWVDHSRKIEAATRKQVLAELDQKKVAAMEEQDHATVVAIDREIKDAEREEEVAEAAPKRTAEFSEFLEKNSWYEDNEEMYEHSVIAGQMYMNKNPDAYQKDMLKHVEKVIKKAYPEEFKLEPNPKRKAAAPVASPKGGSSAQKNKDTFTEADLNHEERIVMNNMLRNSPLTKKEYLAQIAQTRG